jgi:hypothetical protein
VAVALRVRGEDAPAQEEAVATVDHERRAVRVPAKLRLAAFRAADPAGHHLVTWSEGRAGAKALLETQVADAAVLDALERLGGAPGDTLTAEAWTRRDDPDHPAPDARATGARLELSVILPDGERRRLDELVEDVDRRGFEWRLAGNRALIPRWRSGCVVCLQSCPGAKVASARATMRDLARGKSRFRPSALAERLGEGAEVTVELRLVEEEAAPSTERGEEPGADR